ncbi:MAG: hypothetical protein EOO53_16885 [Gammaproteobacteria bacterium]|nr:MAG: hypothetical protein EOO53_16885 [Gammaproteobacteria bacterium]
MSLLNDMLRDLSGRQSVADGTEGYDDALLQASSIAQKKQSSRVQLLILFIVIFFVVAGLKFAWSAFSSRQNPAVGSPQVQKAEPVKANHELIVQAQMTNVSSAAAAVDSVSAAPIDPPVAVVNSQKNQSAENIELKNHINDLLQQAERAIVMDRLTAPVEDNAYGYYQKILSISADNEDAKEGLDKIAGRFLIKAQEQTALGNSQAADALYQRARFISARYVLAHEVNSTEIAEQPSREFTVQSSISEAAESRKSVPSKSETIKPFTVAEAPSVSVSPNAGWKDEQVVLNAQELISKGKQTEAQALLKNFIATEKKPALSVALLADIYLQQNNPTAADIIAEQATYLPIDVKSKLKAQILSINGDDTNAIALLEKNLNSADNNESYRSLLASLYHKTANYPQSIISYQRLINSFGEKPAYWLGLALAYDGLSQHKSALQAYQRLREYPQIQEQVKQYTDQRIAALRSE